jgi:hypothetical protein
MTTACGDALSQGPEFTRLEIQPNDWRARGRVSAAQ